MMRDNYLYQIVHYGREVEEVEKQVRDIVLFFVATLALLGLVLVSAIAWCLF